MQPILIAGPTASGQSALPSRLAKALAVVVINADSIAGLYRYLASIIHGRGPRQWRGPGFPHSVCSAMWDGAKTIPIGRWLADAREYCQQMWMRRGCARSRRRTGLLFQRPCSKASSRTAPVPDPCVPGCGHAMGAVADPGFCTRCSLARVTDLGRENGTERPRSGSLRDSEVLEATGRSLLRGFHEAREPAPPGLGGRWSPGSSWLRSARVLREAGYSDYGAFDMMIAGRCPRRSRPVFAALDLRSGPCGRLMRAHGVPALIGAPARGASFIR